MDSGDVHPRGSLDTGLRQAVPADLMPAGIENVVDQRAYFAPEHVVHDQRNLPVEGHIIYDRCRRVERVGIVRQKVEPGGERLRLPPRSRSSTGCWHTRSPSSPDRQHPHPVIRARGHRSRSPCGSGSRYYSIRHHAGGGSGRCGGAQVVPPFLEKVYTISSRPSVSALMSRRYAMWITPSLSHTALLARKLIVSVSRTASSGRTHGSPQAFLCMRSFRGRGSEPEITPSVWNT